MGVSYAIEAGGNPKAAIWMLEKGYSTPLFLMQASIRRGNVGVISVVYDHLKQTIGQQELNGVLKESFSGIWLHAIAEPDKLCRIVEYLASRSDLKFESFLRKRIFDRNKKRMRLAKTLGNFRYSVYIDAQQAFTRGIKTKLVGWSGLSNQDKHTFLEMLMEAKTNTHLNHVAGLVDEYLFGTETSKEQSGMSCPRVSG